MAWRGLHISQPARLTLADGQMVIEQADGTVRLPIEDLAWLILESPQITLSTALLSACMDGGLAVISTDWTHMPNGAMLTFHGHHRQADMAWRQVAMGEPLKKRLWQAIIRQKIGNQAIVLGKTTGTGEKPLLEMAKLVRSGDPDNVEARAARHYWQTLFRDFRRDDPSDRRNALLNYGYAIVRSALGRALVANGLLPAFGLHHASVSNAFNLADDVIEPFRPFVDQLAHAQGGDTRGDLSLADRRAMAGILLVDICLGEDTMTLLAASEQITASLVRAITANDPSLLLLPKVPP